MHTVCAQYCRKKHPIYEDEIRFPTESFRIFVPKQFFKTRNMYKYLIIFAAAAACLFALSSCSLGSDEDNLKEGQEYLRTNGMREGVVTTASGLQYEVLREGREDGRSPKSTDSVRCHYQGTFISGKVFDSSYSGEPLVFPLNRVIPGWTEGLQYMKEGAKFRFVIPYNLAYGPYGYASIPSYSTLIFEVELLEVL